MGQRMEVIRGLNENHISICKYATTESASYRAVLGRFESIWEDISSQARSVAMVQSLKGPETSESTLKISTTENDQTLEERLKKLGNR
jgi:hypothetical protein